MAKKLYEESTIQAIADAIRAKNGSDATYKPAEMPAAIAAISGSGSAVAENITWHQCPEAVRNYLAGVTYDPTDYTVSHIATYAPATAVQSNTKPVGKTVDGVTYYNGVPGVAAPFSSTNKAGTVKPLDALRWIEAGNDSQGYSLCVNMRDLGGWACDGGKVKYGLLFRGGQPSAYARTALVDKLGIRGELDLQGPDNTRTTSLLGTDVEYCRPAQYQWYTIANKAIWKEIIGFIFDGAKYGRPTLFHCAAGADRTGTVACVLEALLGVSQSDIDKDYELTCFYSGTGTDTNARRRNENDWTGLVNAIKAVALPSGVTDTFRNHAIYFVASLGFTADDINAFRAAMIDGTPDTITLTVDSYTVTKTAEGANITGSDAAAKYQKYIAAVTPANGCKLSAVTVKMDGADIKNSAYRQYAFPTEKGEVEISSVTGNIEISATGVQIAASYTNQIPLSIDTDGSIFNETGYQQSHRINSSGALAVASTGVDDPDNWFATGFIPVKGGDVVRFKNAYIEGTTGGANTRFYDASKNALDYAFTPYSFANHYNSTAAQFGPVEYDTSTQRLYSFTVPNTASASTIKYVRFTLHGQGADAIITINEEISGAAYLVTATIGDHITATTIPATVTEGHALSVTLTPDADYTAKVTVKMGGVDITSTAYSNGAISIASVIADVVITATAVLTGNYVSVVGYTDNKRWSASSGEIKDASGYTAVNLISFTRQSGETLKFKLSGIDWAQSGSNCVLVATKDGAFKYGAYLNTDGSTGAGIAITSPDVATQAASPAGSERIIAFSDPTQSTYAGINGFKVSGYGSGADAVIKQVI